MRILQIGTAGIGLGGVGNYIKNIINENKNTDLKYYFATPHVEGAENNYNYVKYDPVYNVLSIFGKISLIKKIIKDNKIDIVHMHTQRTSFAVILAVLIFNIKVKTVYTPHGFRHLQVENKVKRYQHKLIENFIMKFVDVVTVLTDIELNIFKNYDFKVKKIKSYIDFPILDNCNNKNTQLIVCVGSLDDRKNPDLFLKIASEFSTQNLKFLWVGDGPLINEVLDKKNRLGLENVEFLGRLNHIDVKKVLDDAHIFLFTSKAEGFPLSILEAYSSKCVVISNRFVGVDEIIMENKTGFVFNYNDFSHAIELLNHIRSLKISEINDLRSSMTDFLTPYLNKKRFVSEYECIYKDDFS